MMGKGMKISSLAKYFFLRVINTGAYRKVLIMVAAAILSWPALMAQDADVQPSKTDAQVAWDRGNYELAYKNFNGLLLLYSRDPLYKYYTGACLVKMERDISRAVTLLGSAINSSVNLKSVPDDVWFFYGRSLQIDGSFDQAAEAYKHFAREAGRKVAQEYEVQKYLDQCSLRQGAQDKPASIASGTGTIQSPGPAPQVEPAKITSDDGQKQPQQVKEQKSVIPTQDHPAARGDADKVPDEYYRVLGDALQMQHMADSLNAIAETALADTLEGVSGRKAVVDNKATELAGMVAESQEKTDSLLQVLERHRDTAEEQPAEKHEESIPAHLLYRFEVRSAPSYSAREPVPIDIEMPAGLIYSIQIAAFRNMVSPSLFGGLYPVYGRVRKESGTTYFYTGLFRRLDDARQALPKARNAGFADAFIIALLDGIQVSMERAALLEKEWAGRPIDGHEQVTAGENDRNPDAQVPVETLSFRAEVMRLSKPAKPEVVEKLQLLAGTRGLDMIKNSKGETVVLIGNFITFESADDYVSLLIRNGYSAARVAAYVGMKEIPVETARELLNKMPDD